MRTLLHILFVTLCGLAFAGVPAEGYDAVPAPAAAVVVDSSQEMWLCERHCNSDLNVPVPPVVAARYAGHIVAPWRCGVSAAQRMPVHREERGVAVPAIGSLLPYGAGCSLENRIHAVDYYIFRLRRLII